MSVSAAVLHKNTPIWTNDWEVAFNFIRMRRQTPVTWASPYSSSERWNRAWWHH